MRTHPIARALPDRLVWSGLVRALVLPAAVTAPGCAPPEPDLGRSEAELAGGTVDAPPARFPAVVHLAFPLDASTPGRSFGTCTGILVSPSHVVTAAHCAALTSRAWEGARGFDFPSPTGEDRIQGPIRVSVTLSADYESRPRLARNVRACAVHPDYASNGSTDCRDAYDFARANELRCQLQLQHDVAILTLDAPVPVSWALGAPPSPTDPAAEVLVDFHRLLAPSESPAIGDSVAEVGFGFTDARAASGIGVRRFRDATITGFDLMGADVVALSGGPDEGILAGDSGGPVVWASSPPPGTYPWGDPPIGVHSCSEGFDPSRRHHTSLVVASNLDFVRGQLDRNADGRFDAACEPAGRPGDGICQYLETCQADPDDCGPCLPSCRNSVCEPDLGETCANCRFDCGFCQPVFDVGVGFDPGATPETDRDGDGVLDAADNAPDHFNPCQEDRDGDRVGDAADNCPDRYNPRQDNSDTDSHGDRCDNCPFVANEDQRDVDVEIPDESGDFPTRIGDGAGDACDVCPDRIDSLQADCNEDATTEVRLREAARGVPEAERTPYRGDACDPTPCGETSLASTTSWPPTTVPLRVVRTDRLRVDGLASPPLLEPAQTAFRSCACELADQDTPDRRRACAAASLCSIADLANYERSELEGIEVLPWAFVRFELTDETPPGGFPPIEVNPILDASYDRPGDTFVANRSVRWLNASRGVLWTHTPRFSSGRAFPDPATRELANHYLSGGFREPFTAREPDPCIVLVTPFLGGGLGCPFCGSHFPAPFVAFPGLDGRCFRAGFDVPILFLGQNGVTPGEGLPLDELQLFRNEPTGWVAAAESTPWLPEAGARYARLDDANQVVRVLSVVDERLVDRDANPCPPPQCPGGVLAAAAPPPTGGPGDWPGAVRVLSARLEQLWVIGGRRPDGEPVGDVWSFDLVARTWRSLALPPSARLGHVLAATYSPGEDALYVLDRVERRDRRHPLFPRRWIRLIRLHPDGLAHEVEGQWPALGTHDRYELAVEPSGALWIAASPSRGARVYAALRLVRRPGSGLHIDGWTTGAGRLMAGVARAGDEGLTIAVERGTQVLLPLPVATLRRGPGGERACF